jgi:hypothetical protein
MKKESKKFKVKSRDKQSKTTGVRHSDDDVKKAVVDRIFKIEQLNNIPERYVANHSNCSRSSIGRMCKCKFDGQSPIGQLFIIILLVSLESLNLFPDFPKCCVMF